MKGQLGKIVQKAHYLWQGDEKSLRLRLERAEKATDNWIVGFDALQDEYNKMEAELSKTTVWLILATAALIVSVVVNCWFLLK